MNWIKEILLCTIIGLAFADSPDSYGPPNPGYGNSGYQSQNYGPSYGPSYGPPSYQQYPPLSYQNYGYGPNNYRNGPQFYYTDGYRPNAYQSFNYNPYGPSYGHGSNYGGYSSNYFQGHYGRPYGGGPYGPYQQGGQYGPYGPYQQGGQYGPYGPYQPVGQNGPYGPYQPIGQYGPYQQVGQYGPYQQGGQYAPQPGHPGQPQPPTVPEPPTPPTSPPQGCDDNYQGGCYHLSWRHGANKLNWNQAIKYCLDRGMRAISLDVPAKSSYFLNLLGRDGSAYFWSSGVVHGHDLIWANNVQQPIVPGTGDWSPTGSTGRPQPERKDECVAVLNNFYGDGVKWHDVACHHKKPVICEEQ